MNHIKFIIGVLSLLILNPVLLQAKCLYDDCQSEDSFLAEYTEEELLEGVDIDSLITFEEDVDNCQTSEYGCRATFREAGLMGLYGFFLKTLDWKLSLADEAHDLTLRAGAAAGDPPSPPANGADAVRAAERAAPPPVRSTVEPGAAGKPPVPAAPRVATSPPPVTASLTPWEEALLNRGSTSIRETFRLIAGNPEHYQMNAQIISRRRVRIRGANQDVFVKFRRFGVITSFSCPSLQTPGRFFKGKCTVIGRDTQAMLSNRAGMNRFIAGIKGELPERFVLNQVATRGFFRRWVFSWRGLGIAAVLGGGYFAWQSYNDEGIVADLTPVAVEKLKSAVDYMLGLFSNETVDSVLDNVPQVPPADGFEELAQPPEQPTDNTPPASGGEPMELGSSNPGAETPTREILPDESGDPDGVVEPQADGTTGATRLRRSAG